MSQVVLVTGASRNIGAALARSFAADGFEVIAAARSAERVAEALKDETSDLITVAEVDLADENDVERFADEVISRHARVDILVNNAAYRADYPLAEHPIAEFRRMIDIAVVAPFQLIRRFGPGMAERGWGRIVSFAGLTGQQGSAQRPGVAASKAGVIGMTKALARELGPSGVTVNAVSPGPVATERDWKSPEDETAGKAAIERRKLDIPMRRLAEVEEVVTLCRYLTSEAAASITGQTLSINGGLLMP